MIDEGSVVLVCLCIALPGYISGAFDPALAGAYPMGYRKRGLGLGMVTLS